MALLDPSKLGEAEGELVAEAARIAQALRRVARPDSRFQWDLDSFIPDFEGSERAAERLCATDAYGTARTLFVTPDNALIEFRRRALADGKMLVLPSYGLTRGFLRLDGAALPAGAATYAAWLDGIEHFARPAPLADLIAAGPFEMIVAGASAVTRLGLRFGMGHRYLDIEWGMFAALGLVNDRTATAAMIHPVQLSSAPFAATEVDLCIELIATPDELIRIDQPLRPATLSEAMLTSELDATEVMSEYRALLS